MRLAAVLLALLLVSFVGASGPTPAVDSFSSGSLQTTVADFPCTDRAIKWGGLTGMDLVLLCTNNHVYASRNYGKTWRLISEQLKRSSSTGIVMAVEVMAGTSNVVLMTSNSTWVYDLESGSMLGQSTILYDSTQPQPAPAWLGIPSGSTQSNTAATFDMIVTNPRSPSRAFALKFDPECDSEGVPRPLACNLFLFLTGVQGLVPFLEWKMIRKIDKIWLSAEWSTTDNNGLFVVSKLDPRNIKSAVVYKISVADPSIFKLDTTPSSLVKIVENAIMLQRTEDWLFISAFGSTANPGLSLYASHDDFSHLTRAKFPMVAGAGDPTEIAYSVVDVHNQVFVNVYRTSLEFAGDLFAKQWGTTYISGLNGSHFTLSLEYNRRVSSWGQVGVDFHRVSGLDGVIIANRVLNPTDHSCASCTDQSECAQSCMFGTVISRDNGKTWQELTPPAGWPCPKNYFGSCSLHLHDDASTIGEFGDDALARPILSTASAPGLIIASGNVGSELNFDGNYMTFMSRDGGESWTLLAEGRHIFGETDFGGVLFLAPYGQPTTVLNFSTDAGLTWQTEAIWSTPVVIKEIVRHKMRPAAKHVTIVAIDPADDQIVTLYVDLSNAKSDLCTSNDYEDVTPASYFTEDSSEKCLMGRRTVYRRKKMGRNCWVDSPEGDEASSPLAPKSVTPCVCTRDDYECDWFFVETGPEVGEAADTQTSASGSGHLSSAYCTPAVKDVRKVNRLRCESGARTYEESQGYRKIVGNGCAGGLDLNPVEMPCHPGTGLGDSDSTSSDSSSSHPVLKFFVVVLVLAFIAAVLRLAYLRHAGFKDIVDQLVTAFTSFVPRGGSTRVYSELARDDDDDTDDHRRVQGTSIHDDDDHNSTYTGPASRGGTEGRVDEHVAVVVKSDAQPAPQLPVGTVIAQGRPPAHPLGSDSSDVIEVYDG